MKSSRVPTLTALFLALMLGAAPWRVCAHGDHSGVWVPGLHTHGGHESASSGHAHSPHASCSKACSHTHVHAAHRCLAHAAGAAGRHAHHHSNSSHHHSNGSSTDRTPPGQPPLDQPPLDHDGCHCDDQPLAKCLRSVPVEVAAPQVSGWRDFALHIPVSVRAAGVAPLPREAWRVACESDPTVLLR